MPHTYVYLGRSMLWAAVVVGIGANAAVNWHQEDMNQRSARDRDALHRELREINQKVRNIRAHQVREAIRRGEPVVTDEELSPPPKD